MNTKGIKSSMRLVALVVAVTIAIPLIGAMALLFRAAGLAVIVAGIVGTVVAIAISPTFRGYVLSLGWTATEPDAFRRIGGM